MRTDRDPLVGAIIPLASQAQSRNGEYVPPRPEPIGFSEKASVFESPSRISDRLIVLPVPSSTQWKAPSSTFAADPEGQGPRAGNAFPRDPCTPCKRPAPAVWRPVRVGGTEEHVHHGHRLGVMDEPCSKMPRVGAGKLMLL